MRPILATVVALALSCGAAPIGPAPVGAVPSAAAVQQVIGDVTVFAGASLADAFTEIGDRFRAANPNATVRFNFGASTLLFTQIDQGAEADVFASADQIQMERARGAGHIDGADRPFVTNGLVVVTPAHNPGRITGPGDLARPGLRVVTSQAEVPIGVYTQSMLDRMSESPRYGPEFKDRVNDNIVSREANVRQIVSKVQLGEADAAVVYRSDVAPQVAGQVATFGIPDELNVLAMYPIALVQGARNRAGGAAFIEFVLSPAGQEILGRWNFAPVSR